MDSISEKLRNLFATLAAMIGANPLVYLVLLVIVLAVGVCIFFGIVFDGCNTRRTEEKKAELNTNITTGKVESNVVQNTINKQESNTSQATANLGAIKNSNISNVSGETLDRMAREYK